MTGALSRTIPEATDPLAGPACRGSVQPGEVAQDPWWRAVPRADAG
ncbi:MAG: hypothetical protein H6747_01125 [Deltaproteobacteria bacterium]|nr:hypothetical protein [Deltaproteobacteria bacterium]